MKSPPEVGDVAPDFELPDQDGRRVRLSSFRGRTVVLTFYAEDDTPACTIQVCELRDQSRAFADRRVVVLAVASDPVESHKRFRASARLPFPLLSDGGHRVATAYGAWGEKTMYGRIVTGTIRSTFVIGETGRVRGLLRRLRTKGHGARVLALVDGAARA